MTTNKVLVDYCKNYLNVNDFNDYCPNGLQVEGKNNILKIVSGVSANLELIQAAIKQNVDAIFVHHGIFWKNEGQTITGAKKLKIELLLKHNINLFAYHLPLDAHIEVGNNSQLAKLLQIKNPLAVDNSLVWQGEINLSLSELANSIEKNLKRKPLVFGDNKKIIKKIAWCTGGAQNYIHKAIEINADAYISGEVSEQTPATAKENNISFISAGHHATERYGVQALCKHLQNKFGIEHEFIEIENTV